MTALSTILRTMSACKEAIAWAKPYATLAEGWAECERPDWMCWYLDHVGGYDETLRALALEWADRAVRVHTVAALESAVERESIDATAVRDHIGRLRALEPIRSSGAAGAALAAVRDARGAVRAASYAAAASDAAGAASYAAWAALAAVRAALAVTGAASIAAWPACIAEGAARGAAWAASNAAAASDAAEVAEQRMMCDRIRAVVAEPRTPNLAEWLPSVPPHEGR